MVYDGGHLRVISILKVRLDRLRKSTRSPPICIMRISMHRVWWSDAPVAVATNDAYVHILGTSKK